MKYKLVLIAVLTAILSTMVLPVFANVASAKTGLEGIPVKGTLADGGKFNGKVTITEVGYDEAIGFWVGGVLTGKAKNADGKNVNIEQTFTRVPATLNEQGGAQNNLGNGFTISAQASCDILDLDIGAIHLDLLGLVVDLAPIHLDITALGGAGNLLGNLLCAVAGLLDPGGFLDELIGTLEDLLDLLNQINNLL
jgi:hypothetical protein